ncbi:MAG TPA: hypothetical protein VN947_33385 [Polyangia bacterium]|nr:hypothetical protein [Polyangia bacterium]
MRALFAAMMLVAAGCTGNAGFDFIEVHGTLADGTPVDGHKLASTAVVPSLVANLGMVVAVGSPYNGPEDLAGFRVEWQPGNVVAGMSYPSDPVNGPVVFYVATVAPDAGVSDELGSAVNGGTITFTTVGKKSTGTLSNLVLMRDGATLTTVTSGSFQGTQP